MRESDEAAISPLAVPKLRLELVYTAQNLFCGK